MKACLFLLIQELPSLKVGFERSEGCEEDEVFIAWGWVDRGFPNEGFGGHNRRSFGSRM